MIVVKVGGSLFDHPALGPGLRAFLDALGPAQVLLVAGGGPVADAVRELDRVHALGEEAAHWLALRSLAVTAALLARLVDPADPSGLPILSPPEFPGASPERRCGPGGSRRAVLDCYAFARADDGRPGALPHSWRVTTDSVAARAAVVFGAGRLVLLKSVDVPPGMPWPQAAAAGWVDDHFPQIAPALSCPVEVVNFRRRLAVRA